eukprot:9257503-Alexandrium_andersonii.AAC.1
MSASLVGSEMCIRDSSCALLRSCAVARTSVGQSRRVWPCACSCVLVLADAEFCERACAPRS